MGNFEQDQQVWQQLLSDKSKYISLGTRRGEGEVVRTPVWFVVEGNDLIITTDGSSGKAKRIRNYPEIDLAICDMRGRIRGELIVAAAEVIPANQDADYTRLFSSKFTLSYKLMTMRGRKNSKSSAKNQDIGQIFIRISRDGFTHGA